MHNSLRLEDIEIVAIPEVVDARGKLIHAELDQVLPFRPERIFVIYEVPDKSIRGQHAHRQLCEFVIAVRGEVSVTIDDGQRTKTFLLDSPTKGLVIPPRFWRSLFNYSLDAVLVVAASTKYNADDYIRDYEQFLEFIKL